MRLPPALLLSLLLTFAPAGCGQDAAWPALKQAVRAQYPSVPMITTDSLAARLAADAPRPLLLDVRTPAEFAVSHLSGAHRIDPEARAFPALDSLAPGTPIVTYCSVGWRSAAVAERLRAAGFTNVSNLEGSIFAWANAGHPVVREGRPVRQVHPYDAVWGRLLRRDLHAYTP